MTHQELDSLFDSARNAPMSTSVDDVTQWVGAAGAVAGSIGLAAKLKLLIAKKAIMLGSVLGTVSIATVSVLIYNSSPEAPKNQPILNAAGPGIEFKMDEPVTEEETIKPEKILLESEPAEPTVEEPTTPAMPTRSQVLVLSPEFEMGIAPFSGMSVVHVPTHNSPPPHVESCDCDCDGDEKTVKGNGKVVKKEREVSSFREIEIDGTFDVIISQGDKEKVVVETDENLQQYIEVEVNDNRLLLDNASCTKIKKVTKKKVYVTVKDLSKLLIDGVGNVEMSSLKTKDLEIIVDGVGNSTLDFTCTNLDLESDGVGNVKLSGSADNAHMTCDGVGNMSAANLVVGVLNVENSSVGNVRVNATKEIKIYSSGVGSLTYSGGAEVKEIKSSGIGTVREKK